MDTQFKAGDYLRVSQRIIEGKKERDVAYEGVVVRVKGSGDNATFTLRQTLDGVDVDRIFPLRLPSITNIKILQAARKNVGKLRKIERFVK